MDLLRECALAVGSNRVELFEDLFAVFEFLTVLALFGNFAKVDGQAGVVGERSNVEPLVQRGEVLLERDGLVGLHCPVILFVEGRVDDIGDLFPQVQPLEGRFLRGMAHCGGEHLLSLLVGVGDPPVGIDGKEAIAHPVQDRVPLGFRSLGDVTANPSECIGALFREPRDSELVGDAVAVCRNHLCLDDCVTGLYQFVDCVGDAVAIRRVEEVGGGHRPCFRARVPGNFSGSLVPEFDVTGIVGREEDIVESVDQRRCYLCFHSQPCLLWATEPHKRLGLDSLRTLASTSRVVCHDGRDSSLSGNRLDWVNRLGSCSVALSAIVCAVCSTTPATDHLLGLSTQSCRATAITC